MPRKPLYETLEKRLAEFKKRESERDALVKQLRGDLNKHKAIFDSADDLIAYIGPDYKILDVNKQVETVFGYKKKEVIGKSFADFDIFSPEDMIRAVKLVDRAISGETIPKVDFEAFQKDGTRKFVEISNQTIKRGGHVKGLVLIVRDATERIITEEKLRESEDKFRTIFENANDEIIYTSIEGTFIDVNDRIEDIFGYKREEIIGKHYDDIKLVSDKELKKSLKLYDEAVKDKPLRYMEFEGIRKDGSPVPIELSTRLIKKNGEIKGTVNIIRDITERKIVEAQIKKAYDELEERVQERTAELQIANQELLRLSEIDGLTRIANRRRFDKCLLQEWKRLSREQNKDLSLLMCDVDFFKSYNDKYGHLAGDDCLKDIAQSIDMKTQRPADLVARYGGEEFTAILPNTDAKGALYVAECMRKDVEAMKIPHADSGISSFVTISVGIACMTPSYEMEPSTIVKSADDALYEAKSQGRNRSVLNGI